MPAHTLKILASRFAVCQLPPDTPPRALGDLEGDLVVVSRTPEELTVVCAEAQAPSGGKTELGWMALKVEGPFELTSTVGVLASLTTPIAGAGVSVFAVSTWNTDYILVQDDRVHVAVDALERAGHRVIADPG